MKTLIAIIFTVAGCYIFTAEAKEPRHKVKSHPPVKVKPAIIRPHRPRHRVIVRKPAPTLAPQVVYVQPPIPTAPLVLPSNVIQGSQKLQGDPVLGAIESYKSWKSACSEWKQEMISLNKSRLVSLDCGQPVPNKNTVTFQVTQVSMATYQVMAN